MRCLWDTVAHGPREPDLSCRPFLTSAWGCCGGRGEGVFMWPAELTPQLTQATSLTVPWSLMPGLRLFAVVFEIVSHCGTHSVDWP